MVNKDLALKQLWKRYFDYIFSYGEAIYTIFFHNLGSFDGFFLYRALLKYSIPGCVNTIIDDANKFITITVTELFTL
jgi:hypothetical protein